MQISSFSLDVPRCTHLSRLVAVLILLPRVLSNDWFNTRYIVSYIQEYEGSKKGVCALQLGYKVPLQRRTQQQDSLNFVHTTFLDYPISIFRLLRLQQLNLMWICDWAIRPLRRNPLPWILQGQSKHTNVCCMAFYQPLCLSYKLYFRFRSTYILLRK